MIGSNVHPARQRVEPSQMNSVFDAFNLRRLLDIHWPMASMQWSKRTKSFAVSQARQWSWSCKSSAYPWMKNPSSSAILETAVVYRTKNNGPKKEPWGTPNWTTVVEDVNPLYLMYCLLSPVDWEGCCGPRNRMQHSDQAYRVEWVYPYQLRSEVSFKRAVSLEWLRRYADWCSGRRPFEWK